MDGGWSEYGNWSSCTGGICGVGIQYRNRTCTNPEPVGGGADCTGESGEERNCDLGTCSQPRCPGEFKLINLVNLAYVVEFEQ